MSVFSRSQVQPHTVGPDHYREQQNLHRRLKRQTQIEDKEAEERRKLWNMNERTPLLITLHQDRGKIPGGVKLQMDTEVSRYAIHKRAATPTGDLSVEPDAVIEGVSVDDIAAE